jgi:hypothetical protein
MNNVWAFKRQFFKKSVGSFQSEVLDMKISPFGCHLFVPIEAETLSRLKLDLQTK